MKTKKIYYHFVSFLLISLLFFPRLILAEDLSIPETGLPDPPGGIKDILSNFLNWLLGIIGMIAIISFAVSGIQYFIAAGDEKDMETAKRNMMYSIVGVIVALSGLIIVKVVDAMLRGNSSEM